MDMVMDQSFRMSIARNYARNFMLSLVIGSAFYSTVDMKLAIFGIAFCAFISLIILCSERRETRFRSNVLNLKLGVISGRINDAKDLYDRYVKIHNQSYDVYTPAVMGKGDPK